MEICDRDCFNCRYDDCILPEEKISIDEIKEIDRREKNPKFRTPKEKERFERQRKYFQKYRLANLGKFREYHKAYRSKNKEKLKEYKRQYYLKNKEWIDEKNKLLYMKKEKNGGKIHENGKYHSKYTKKITFLFS